ncbi:hypothetical protein GF322_02745 [Candidatus Dependentiae bacterium]|nr:hypothetical protein [Candidatus Dependentiae bacterium]
MNFNALSIMFNTKFLPLIYAIIGFGLLIMIHEFGHFIFCKIFNIYTPTFSIGMGPKIIEKKIGTTRFQIAALPIGGYVEIAGQSEPGQGKQEYAHMQGEKSFANKSYWKKALVICGGIIFNIIFAYLVYSILFFIGIPKQKSEVFFSKKIDPVITESFDIKAEDKIVSINTEDLSNDPKKLISQLQNQFLQPLSKNSKTQQIKLEIMRNDHKIFVDINTQDEKINNKILNSIQLKSSPIEGEYEKYSFFGSIIQGIKVTNQWIYQILYSFKYLISQRSLKGAGGPIMILSKTFETAQKGIIPLFIFLAFISINLAIINLLPIGALDGGQLLFITIEAIIRRPIPEIIKMTINIASLVLLISLIIYLSYKDLLYLITGKIS